MNTAATQGHIKRVTSQSNPIIKTIRSLQQKKNRDAQGLFLAEGFKLIADASENGWNISTLIYGQSVVEQSHFMELALKLRGSGTDLLEVSDKVLQAISRRDNPQMVIGVIEQKWTELSRVHANGDNLWIALDRVRDPGNLGTIIRTADCVGAEGVMLIGETTDPWSLEAVRATMGSVFNVTLAKCTRDEFISWCKNWSGLVVGTHLAGAVDYREIEYNTQPVIALMGNEQQGLPEELVAVCDHKAIIPMNGKADSLNLAIATAIMAFEIKRSSLKL